MQYHPDILHKLKAEIGKPLPGEEAQYRMAPAYRPRMSKSEVDSLKPRLGGVLLMLFERDGLLKIVFTKRKDYPGVHSGQISFPGGKRDESDVDLTATALRETEEEIGISKQQITLIGSLSPLYIPPSNFMVYPSVGFANGRVNFIPQETEVAEVLEIPLDFFLDQNNINLEAEIVLFDGNKVKAPAFIYNEHKIWGATAIVLSEFSYILEKLR